MCDAITSGWVAGQRDVSVLARTCSTCWLGKTDRDDRGISHGVMEVAFETASYIFYRYNVLGVLQERQLYTSEVVLLYNHCINYSIMIIDFLVIPSRWT